MFYHTTGDNDSVFSKYFTGKGIVKFEEIEASLFSGSEFYNEDWKYYINTLDNPMISTIGSNYGYHALTDSLTRFVLGFNPETNKVIGLRFEGWFGDEVSDPARSGKGLSDDCSMVSEGYLRPSKHNSVLYGKEDSRCGYSDLVVDGDARGTYVYLNYMGTIGDALIQHEDMASFVNER